MAHRMVCHRCRHTWKQRKAGAHECPKCGHGNVGPSRDSGGGGLGKLVVIGLIGAVAAAWYLDLLPGEAKAKLDEAKDAIETTVEEVQKEVGADPKAGPGERPQPAPEQTRAEPKPRPKPAQADDETKIPLPKVVVRSKSGVALATSYLVKGKVKNEGGAKAGGVRVEVRFLDSGGELVSKVEAQCEKRALDPGESAKYEAAVAGSSAERVDRFEVEVSFD